MLNFKNLLARALLALTLAAGAGAAVAGPTYHVDADTSTLGAASGYLDFLIVGQGDIATTTATLSHFTGNFSGGVYTDGATGSTAGATVGSGGIWNEFALWASFGGKFGFDVSFDQALDDIAGALLQVALLDANFAYLAPTGNDIAQFSVMPGQPVGLMASDFAKISVVPVVSDVPEPADLALMATGLGLLGVTLRRRA
jgi:hypothetical protein